MRSKDKTETPLYESTRHRFADILLADAGCFYSKLYLVDVIILVNSKTQIP